MHAHMMNEELALSQSNKVIKLPLQYLLHDDPTLMKKPLPYVESNFLELPKMKKTEGQAFINTLFFFFFLNQEFINT